MNASLIMFRGNADLPYVNEVRMAHQARNLVYRMGPCHKVQLVVPSAPHPSPQSAVVQTLGLAGRRSSASSNLRAAYSRIERGETEAGPQAAKAEDAKTGHVRNQKSRRIDQGQEWYLERELGVSYEKDRPRDRGLAAGLDDSQIEDTLVENDDGRNVAPLVVGTHRALYSADFEDSGDEESLCDDDDIRGSELEANTGWLNRNQGVDISQEQQLTTIQLRIQENMLRDIARQAFKARRDSNADLSFFGKEAPGEEDWVLETILNLMELGQTMIDARAFQEEEGRDIQVMVRNSLSTLLRKARHPFRPSGISAANVQLTQCLDALRQMRLRLLQENPGRSIAEILKEKNIDLRPRRIGLFKSRVIWG
ncbi:hypothetical protein IMSHALPRED_005390 [Imshaugia aleurites]|uniref:Uncharacterized protein n=1 Tax=Imshaugia aleurites TaxID=172621 RepID=A0A8H3EJG9_9LECA|nr:hypothetical protein IMSHALPRED_005390 [Imshaugia aleurites]